MLVSKSKGFIYFHLYKVAGTSVRSALRPYCAKKQVIYQNLNYILSLGRIRVFTNPLYQFHPDLKLVKQFMGKDFYNYYKFTFVRDPFDWQKSLYFFAKKNPRHHQHDLIKRFNFEQYIDWRLNYDLKLQSDLISDDSGLLVDDVYKFENIDEEVERLNKKLGLNITLPHKNKAGFGKDVIISDALLSDFNDAFRKDYEVLGYTEKKVDL